LDIVHDFKTLSRWQAKLQAEEHADTS